MQMNKFMHKNNHTNKNKNKRNNNKHKNNNNWICKASLTTENPVIIAIIPSDIESNRQWCVVSDSDVLYLQTHYLEIRNSPDNVRFAFRQDCGNSAMSNAHSIVRPSTVFLFFEWDFLRRIVLCVWKTYAGLFTPLSCSLDVMNCQLMCLVNFLINVSSLFSINRPLTTRIPSYHHWFPVMFTGYTGYI